MTNFLNLFCSSRYKRRLYGTIKLLLFVLCCRHLLITILTLSTIFKFEISHTSCYFVVILNQIFLSYLFFGATKKKIVCMYPTWDKFFFILVTSSRYNIRNNFKTLNTLFKVENVLTHCYFMMIFLTNFQNLFVFLPFQWVLMVPKWYCIFYFVYVYLLLLLIILVPLTLCLKSKIFICKWK